MCCEQAKSSKDFVEELGYLGPSEIIHRDNISSLALGERSRQIVAAVHAPAGNVSASRIATVAEPANGGAQQSATSALPELSQRTVQAEIKCRRSQSNAADEATDGNNMISAQVDVCNCSI